jgi:hypothetical protein
MIPESVVYFKELNLDFKKASTTLKNEHWPSELLRLPTRHHHPHLLQLLLVAAPITHFFASVTQLSVFSTQAKRHKNLLRHSKSTFPLTHRTHGNRHSGPFALSSTIQGKQV